MSTKRDEGMGINAYARHRAALNLPGKTRASVQEAIESGRLAASVAYVGGRPRIRDVELADREWAEATKAEHIPITNGGEGASALAAARTRRETALAGLAEIELAKEQGALVRAADVEAAMVGMITRSRNKIMGVPAGLRQRDPTFTLEQVRLVEDLIREALEELAANGGKS